MTKQFSGKTDELGQWLEDLGLTEHAPTFIKNKIEFEVLPELSDSDLEFMGILLGHRRKMLRAIAALSKELPPTVEAGFAEAPARSPALPPTRHDAERRQLTIMFCDLVGSTQLSEMLDPEDLVDVISKYQDACLEVIEKFEGFHARFVGDGALIYFGYPRAHEDAATRAVRAGLGIVKAVPELEFQPKLTLSVRVGIATGKVVVGNIVGKKTSEQDVVFGQAPNLAARLQGIAEPNSVVIGPNTHHLVNDWFVCADHGQQRLKGFSEPTQVFEVLRESKARTRLQAATSRGLTPYVGREDQLKELRRLQERAGKGHGQVVAIEGHAGVGKSRLVHEFTHSRRIKKENWLVLDSSAASSGYGAPYLPITELLKQYLEISDLDNAQSIRNKVTDKISALKLSQDEIPPILDLLDAIDDGSPFRSLDPVQRRRDTDLAVSRLLISESSVRPIVAIFEDLHQTDSLTLGLLDGLLIAAENARLLLVVSYRPPFKDKWEIRPDYKRVHLRQLVSENRAKLLEALLGSDPSLSPLKSSLVERAGGNPFFVEEFVRQQVDAGVLKGTRGEFYLPEQDWETAIPPTVERVLVGRIGALGDDDRDLLQHAAVIGHEVPFALLREIWQRTEDELRKRLKKLEETEFLYRTKLYPDLQYTFKHSLTRDVAYSGLLHKRREEIHAHIVDVIENLYADQLSEQVERLAHHAAQGKQHEKASRYLHQAGKRAARRYALVEARKYFEKALGVFKKLPESNTALENAFDVHLELRSVLRQLGEVRQMRKSLHEAEAISERLKDDLRHGRVCAALTSVLSTLDKLDEAVEKGTLGLEIARRRGDQGLGTLCASSLVKAYFYRGEYEHVVKLAKQKLEELPEEWDLEYFGMAVPASVFIRAWLIMSLAELGRFAEAAKYEAEVIQLAELTQHPHTMGWANLAASTIHLCKGDWAKVNELVEPWTEETATSDVAVLLPWAVGTSAWALAQFGEDKRTEALARVDECEQRLQHLVERGIVGHRGWAYHAMGRACLLLGELDAARRLTQCVDESSQRQPGVAAHALCLLGDITTHPDSFDAESGAAYYRQALSRAEQHGMRPLIARCHLGLGKLYRRIGRAEDAHENLDRARTMYGEMDMDIRFERKD